VFGWFSPGQSRDREVVSVLEAQRVAKPNLAEQLDLIWGVPGLSGLVGLEREAAIASADEDGDVEVARLARSRVPVWPDIGGGQVLPLRASLERSRQQHVERAGHDREAHQLREPLQHGRVCHQLGPETAAGSHRSAQVALGQRQPASRAA
jgi:hypothetical protein